MFLLLASIAFLHLRQIVALNSDDVGVWLLPVRLSQATGVSHGRPLAPSSLQAARYAGEQPFFTASLEAGKSRHLVANNEGISGGFLQSARQTIKRSGVMDRLYHRRKAVPAGL
jgi:hypothetical protein